MNNNPVVDKKYLDGYLSKILNDFNNYTLTKDIPISGIIVDELIKVTDSNPDNFVFDCLGWNFIIRKVMHPFDQTAFLKTYQIELDEDNYPAKKLDHLKHVDIRLTLPLSNGLHLEYPATKQLQFGDKIIPITGGHITDFNKQYLTQFLQALQQKHSLK